MSYPLVIFPASRKHLQQLSPPFNLLVSVTASQMYSYKVYFEPAMTAQYWTLLCNLDILDKYRILGNFCAIIFC